MRLLVTGALALLLALPANAQLAQPSAAGVSFGHVHLNVADMELHKRLWVEHFDGIVVQKGSLTTIKFPGMFIVLSDREPTGDADGNAMDHFGFKVRDITAVLAAWRAAGLEVEAEFTGAEGFDNAYLIAPDGIRVELQEDTALPAKATAYHVHFFTDAHLELMNWYIDTFGAVQRARGTHTDTADVPGMNLSFNGSGAERDPSQGRAIDHVGFEVDNLEAFCETLAANGVEFQVPYRYIESIELAIAFFIDPAGVRVELTEGLDAY